MSSAPTDIAEIDVFVVVHDQDLLIERERIGTYESLGRFRFLFVGSGAIDRIDGRDDVIVVRSLTEHIEQFRHLLTFTAWYAVVRNGLSRAERVAILEYDIEITDDFVEQTVAGLDQGSAVVGYISFPLSHPMYLHATSWLSVALDETYDLDVEQLVRTRLAAGHPDRWTATTNLAMRAETLAEFVDWFWPMTACFRDDPVGAHVHERAVPVFCHLRGIDNRWVPDVLTHAQARSHGILARPQEQARALAARSAPLTPPSG